MSVTMHTSTTMSLLVAVLLLPLEHANVAASSAGARTKTYPLPLVKKMVASVLQHQIADPSRRILNKANIYSTLGTEFQEISRRKRSASQLKNVLTVQDEDRLGTMVGDLMDCLQITGLSLGLVKGGAQHAMGYGLADMETGRSVDNETLFGIGSNTMAFTAATIAHLVNTPPVGKRVQWNTPLADILDDFRMPDDMRTAHMTLLDVLTHRTGLGSGKLGVIAGFPPNVTVQEMSRNFHNQHYNLSPENDHRRSTHPTAPEVYVQILHKRFLALGNEDSRIFTLLGTDLAPGSEGDTFRSSRMKMDLSTCHFT